MSLEVALPPYLRQVNVYSRKVVKTSRLISSTEIGSYTLEVWVLHCTGNGDERNVSQKVTHRAVMATAEVYLHKVAHILEQ